MAISRLRHSLLVALFLPVIALAAPYDLDMGWGESGRLTLADHARIFSSILQSDGGLVLILEREVRRARADGSLDTDFGSDGRIGAPMSDLAITGSAQRPDDGLDIIWRSEPVYLTAGIFRCSQRYWMRYGPSGHPDGTFGAGAGVNLNGGCSGSGLIAGGDGDTYWISSAGVSFAGIYSVNVNRYGPAGNRLDDLDSVSQDFRLAPVWEPSRLAIDAHRRVVASARLRDQSQGFGAIRYAGVGRDPAFGEYGVADEPVPGFISQAGALPMPDGRILAFGAAYSDGRAQPALVRFIEGGQIDASFGVNGLAVAPLTRPGELLGVPAIALAPDGRIVVAADVSIAGIVYSRVARLLADGKPDTRFGGAGVAPTTYGAGLHSLAVRPSGEIVLGLATELVQLRGGEAPAARPLRERRVIEYFHEGYGHYFITADEPEIAILDTAPTATWKRTSKSFNVADSAFAPLVPMCRFWSDQSFAPKSSHFYTPYAEECAIVKKNPTWLFERNAFYALLPEGTPGARTCTPATRPLYRAYNDGQGGAPNHRYTTDPAVLDAMLAQGWVMEGEAATRVFACVPAE